MRREDVMVHSDEAALIGLLHRYADAVRTRDVALCSETWVDDGRWVLDASRDVVGREAITQMWLGALTTYDLVVQLYLSTAFDIDGSVASGRCQMLEFDELNGARSVVGGHYDDTYRRTEDGWRFTSRRWTRHFKWAL